MNNIILKAKGVKQITRQESLNIGLPERTESYTPISQKEIITTALEQLDKQGLKLKSEFHKTDGSEQKFVGGFIVSSQGNSEMDMMFGYKNSYDRSMSAAYASGAQIFICSNSSVRGEQSLIRKHTGNADNIIKLAIIEGISKLGDNFRFMEKEMQKMKEVEITKRIASELIGRLYLEEETITARQLAIIKQELTLESYDYGIKNSLFNLYQAVTHSLKSSHPVNWLNSHVDSHTFFVNESGFLVGQDKLTIPTPGSHPQVELEFPGDNDLVLTGI